MFYPQIFYYNSDIVFYNLPLRFDVGVVILITN